MALQASNRSVPLKIGDQWKPRDSGLRKASFSGALAVSFRECTQDVGVEPRIGGGYPKMDGENKGKPYEQMDDLGGPPLFLETAMCFWEQLAVVTLTTGRGLIAWQTAVDRHGKHSCRFNV